MKKKSRSRNQRPPKVPKEHLPSLESWRTIDKQTKQAQKSNVIVDCGWGRLIFAHTFERIEQVAEALCSERPNERDIAFYVRDPHVLLSSAPQQLFLDPSHTFRLRFDMYHPSRQVPKAFQVRRIKSLHDLKQINRILSQRHMMNIDENLVWGRRNSRTLMYLVAEDRVTGEIIGSVLGVDHCYAFDDTENGSSLWSLAVDPLTHHPGVGECLVRALAEHFIARGRAYMDLSVLHDNEAAIHLYEKLGFQRAPVFCVKRKNDINEPLFVGPSPDATLNPYAEIIVREARRRGIAVEILDSENGFFRLTFGGTSIVCRESLTELTSAIAMSRCDDKRITSKIFNSNNLRVPVQRLAGTREENQKFLKKHKRVVVKPVRGEQGQGVAVDIQTYSELERAIKTAKSYSDHVLLEEMVKGEDLRVIVIDYKVVAAAMRRPPEVIGDGKSTVQRLITRLNKKRMAATKGESRVPLDDETERCVKSEGYSLTSILPEGAILRVRKTANLHTGGHIVDVTDKLNPELAKVAINAARVLNIPVVGLDFMVSDPSSDEYYLIEANERPGLANHEPQPTAQRFIDLLFPQTIEMRASSGVTSNTKLEIESERFRH